MHVGNLRSVAVGLVLAGVLAVGAPGPAPAPSATDVVSAVVPSSTSSASAASSSGNTSVTVGYVVIGSRLHLRTWPLHRGQQIDIRIDIWVAPNTGRSTLMVLRGDGVGLAHCTGTALRAGHVNRIRCDLMVPRGAPVGINHLRVVVRTSHGAFGHSFVVLVR